MKTFNNKKAAVESRIIAATSGKNKREACRIIHQICTENNIDPNGMVIRFGLA